MHWRCAVADRVLVRRGRSAVNARLHRPRGLVLAPDGSLYFADSRNHRIRRVGPDGIITTAAGDGVASAAGRFGGDGGPPAQAGFDRPWGIALAPDGGVYVLDTYNNRLRRF